MPKGVPTRVASEIVEAACTDATLKLCNDITENGLKVAIVGCLAGGPPGALLAIAPVLALVSLKAWTAWREKQDDAAIRAELAQAKELLEKVKLDQADSKAMLTDLVERRSWVAARLPGYEKDELAERVAERVLVDMQREMFNAIEQQRLLDDETVDGLRIYLSNIAEAAFETRDVVKGIDEKLTDYITGNPATAATLDRRFSLPPVPIDFTGRVKELDDLLGRITGGATISAVRGMGGIGKTALALVLAHKIKGGYEHGHIMVEMRGTATGSEKPLTSAEAMAHVVRAFHPEAKQPERDAEIAALYHSTLNGKKVLLLLDNAANRTQVEPLLPPEGCLLLVTSRTKIALGALAEVDLGVMDAGEAAELLRTLCPRIDDGADALAELCGYLPLALRLAGRALAERTDLSVARYAERLRDERLTQLDRYADEGEATITASLMVSEDLLREQQADLVKRWLMLGAFPTDFDALATTAVWGLPLDQDNGQASVDEARDALGELRMRSLVEWDKDTKRYSLHDLVREYVVEGCDLDTSDAAGKRHAEHFVNVLGLANAWYMEEGGKRLADGLALYDAEADNIETGFAWANMRVKHHADARRLVDLYAGWANILALRQSTADREAWLLAAMATADLGKDRERVALHAGNLGVAMKSRGDLDGAEAMHQKALAIDEDLGHKEGMASHYGNLGVILMARGNLDEAEAMHRKALAIDEELGRKEGMASNFGNLGNTLFERGDLKGAEAMHRKALAIDKSLGRMAGVAGHFGNLGLILRMRGDLDGAEAMHRQALTVAKQLSRKEEIANQYGNLSVILMVRGDLDGAEALLHKGLAINDALGLKRGMANQYANLGLIALQQEDMTEARRLWTLARTLFAEMGAKPMVDKTQGLLDRLDDADGG